MLRCWATLETAQLYMKTRVTSIDWLSIIIKSILALVLILLVLVSWGTVHLAIYLYKSVALLFV
jgi:hypothetical protein